MKYSKQDFIPFIEMNAPALSKGQIEGAAFFAELLYAENEIQNLTRIIGVEEFFYGHLVDVIELLKLPALGKRVLDLGSGCGVPGLLAAAIDLDTQRSWVLVESETKKAEFLSATAQRMGLKNVLVLPARVESVIEECAPDTVIARAVGTVEKISAWIWKCSTWNNLVLFKSQGWEKEWDEAAKSRFGKKLTVIHLHEYPAQEKRRLLITLKRK